MAFGFPAYHTERYVVKGSVAHLRDAVRSTVSDLRWSIRNERGDQITASANISMWSWGETVVIDFLPDGSLSITSKCVYPLQCVDWGKNKENVDRLLSRLRKLA